MFNILQKKAGERLIFLGCMVIWGEKELWEMRDKNMAA